MSQGRPLKKLNLTEREIEIVKISILGKTYNETGELLHISGKTVSTHMSNIYSMRQYSDVIFARKIKTDVVTDIIIICGKLIIYK